MHSYCAVLIISDPPKGMKHKGLHSKKVSEMLVGLPPQPRMSVTNEGLKGVPTAIKCNNLDGDWQQ